MRSLAIIFGIVVVSILPVQLFLGENRNVPWWIDYYLLLILLAFIPVWVLTIISKPNDIALIRIDQVELNFFTAILSRFLKGLMAAFIGIYALGLGLMLLA